MSFFLGFTAILAVSGFAILVWKGPVGDSFLFSSFLLYWGNRIIQGASGTPSTFGRVIWVVGILGLIISVVDLVFSKPDFPKMDPRLKD